MKGVHTTRIWGQCPEKPEERGESGESGFCFSFVKHLSRLMDCVSIISNPETHASSPTCLLHPPGDDQSPGLCNYHFFASQNNSFILPGFELLKNGITLHLIFFPIQYFVRFIHVVLSVTSLYICCYVRFIYLSLVLLMDICAISSLCIFHALV